MPALPPAPKTLRVTLKWHLGEDLTAINRFFLRYTGGPPSAADCVTLATAVHVSAVTNLIPLLQTASKLEEVDVQDLDTLSGAFGTHIAEVAGTRAGELPADAAVLMNMHLPRRYRGGKPRTYWPFGVAGDLADPQTWSAGALAAFQTGIFAFFGAVAAMTAGTTVTTGWRNVSYYQSFTLVVNPITGRGKNVSKPRLAPVIDEVITATINTHVASQRRRTLIRGG